MLLVKYKRSKSNNIFDEGNRIRWLAGYITSVRAPYVRSALIVARKNIHIYVLEPRQDLTRTFSYPRNGSLPPLVCDDGRSYAVPQPTGA